EPGARDCRCQRVRHGMLDLGMPRSLRRHRVDDAVIELVAALLSLGPCQELVDGHSRFLPSGHGGSYHVASGRQIGVATGRQPDRQCYFLAGAVWVAAVAAGAAAGASSTVRITLDVGRSPPITPLISLLAASSHLAIVASGVLAFMCTTL